MAAETPAPGTATESTTTEGAPKALTPEQVKQLHDKLRARMQISRLKVSGPVGLTAYWARKNDDSELARLDYMGFRIVKDDRKAPKWKAQGAREDGTYVMGDVILMCIPTEEYEFFRSENSRRSSEMSGAVKQQFRDAAEKAGAPTFVLDRK